MTEQILPAFWRCPAEGTIIGRLLAGYGELEFELAVCLGATLGDDDEAFRELFKRRGEERRIQTANALMADAFAAINERDAFSEMISDLGWCKSVRNRYAHCHWNDLPADGLCYFDLEAWAKKDEVFHVVYKPLPLAVLEQQEAYFRYVQSSIWYLEAQMRKSKGLPRHALPRPTKLRRPPDHG